MNGVTMKWRQAALFIFLIIIVKIDAAEEDDLEKCQTYEGYCISGSVTRTVLNSTDNKFFKVENEGPDATLHVLQGFDQSTSNKYIELDTRTQDKPRPEFYIGAHAPLCRHLKTKPRKPYALARKLLKMLFDQYEDCTSESVVKYYENFFLPLKLQGMFREVIQTYGDPSFARKIYDIIGLLSNRCQCGTIQRGQIIKEYIVPTGFSGVFSLDVKPPCHEFEMILKLWEDKYTEIPDLMMIVKVVPNNVTPCNNVTTNVTTILFAKKISTGGISDPEPQAEPEAKPEPESASQSTPEPEMKPEPESEPQSTPEPEMKPEPESEPQSTPEPEMKPEPESEPQSTPEPEMKPEPESEPQSTSYPERKPESDINDKEFEKCKRISKNHCYFGTAIRILLNSTENEFCRVKGEGSNAKLSVLKGLGYSSSYKYLDVTTRTVDNPEPRLYSSQSIYMCSIVEEFKNNPYSLDKKLLKMLYFEYEDCESNEPKEYRVSMGFAGVFSYDRNEPSDEFEMILKIFDNPQSSIAEVTMIVKVVIEHAIQSDGKGNTTPSPARPEISTEVSTESETNHEPGTVAEPESEPTHESEIEPQPETIPGKNPAEQGSSGCHYFKWLRNYSSSHIPNVGDYYKWLTSNGCIYETNFNAKLAQKSTWYGAGYSGINTENQGENSDCNYFKWLRSHPSSYKPKVGDYYDWLASNGCFYGAKYNAKLSQKYPATDLGEPEPTLKDKSRDSDCDYHEWLRNYSSSYMPNIEDYYHWLTGNGCIYDPKFNTKLAEKYLGKGAGDAGVGVAGP